MTHVITLPWPPSLNHNIRHNRGGHHLSERHKTFRESASGAIYHQVGLPRRPCGRCRIAIELTPPTRAKRDIDNYIKPILDVLVLTRVLGGDDTQFVQEIRVSCVDRTTKGGSCLVRIEELQPAATD